MQMDTTASEHVPLAHHEQNLNLCESLNLEHRLEFQANNQITGH